VSGPIFRGKLKARKLASLSKHEDTFMFLGRYNGSQAVRTRSNYFPLLTGQDVNRATRVDAFAATFAIKKLAMQVFSVRRPLEDYFDEIGMIVPGNWDDVTIQIWPTSGAVGWPPPLVFNEAGFDLFTNRWNTLIGPT
jgi:hypothetical protein